MISFFPRSDNCHGLGFVTEILHNLRYSYLDILNSFPASLSDLSIKLPCERSQSWCPSPHFTDKETEVQRTQFPHKDPGVEPSRMHACILNTSFSFLSTPPKPLQLSFSKHPEQIHFDKNLIESLYLSLVLYN